MVCSARVMKYTGYLHVLALIVASIGTYKQIESVQKGEPVSIALSLSLMIMLLLRIPNQVCVAYESAHGWYSVIGTLFGATAFAILTYFNYMAMKKHNSKQQHYTTV